MTSQADLFEAHGRTLKAEIHTSLPGSVVSYDPVTNVVEVQPSIQEPLFLRDGEDREYHELPTVSVGVVWPRFGGKVVRGKLIEGDSVLLVFSEASLAEWRATGQLSEPVDGRRHSIGYAFAIPGAFPDCKPMSPADAVEVAAGALIIGEDGGDQMLIGGTEAGIRFGKLAMSPVALAIPTDAGIAGVITAINAIMTLLVALITALTAHTHLSAAPGSPTGPMIPAGPMPAAPSPLAPAPTTASVLVKSL